ncbi:MAG: hypothetical protein U9N59_07060 [Campylobacterota bacterium]|nr:hypothetical protein [Campylobacterota bacterium]
MFKKFLDNISNEAEKLLLKIDINYKENKDNVSTIRTIINTGKPDLVENLIKYADFNINQVDENKRSLL